MRRKKKMILLDRAEEIYDALPKEFAHIIINSVIAKSLDTGLLLKEASPFMQKEKIDELINELHINIKTQAPRKATAPIFKEKEKKVSPLFEGFS